MRLPLAVLLSVIAAMPAAAQDSSVFGAELLPISPVGDIAFSLRKPAYVAVFEFVPGRGITQIFPGSTEEARRMVPAGTALITDYQIAFYRYASTWNASWVRGSGRAPPTPFRTYLLVASDKPLSVASPTGTASALHRVMRWQPLSLNVITPDVFASLVDAIRPTIPGAIIETDAVEGVYRTTALAYNGSAIPGDDAEDGIYVSCYNGITGEPVLISRAQLYSTSSGCRPWSLFSPFNLPTPTVPRRHHADSTVCVDSARARRAGSGTTGPIAAAQASAPSPTTAIAAAHGGQVRTETITDLGEIARMMDALHHGSDPTITDGGLASQRRISIGESARGGGATPAQRAEPPAPRAESPVFRGPSPAPRPEPTPQAAQSPARPDPTRDIPRKP